MEDDSSPTPPLALEETEADKLLLIEEAKMEGKDKNIVPGLRLYLLKPLRAKTDANLKQLRRKRDGEMTNVCL